MKSHVVASINVLLAVVVSGSLAVAQEKANPKEGKSPSPTAKQASETAKLPAQPALQSTQFDATANRGIVWLHDNQNLNSGVFTLSNLAIRSDDDRLGAELFPADEVLRAQLKLAAGQGLVVTRVVEGGAAAQAGLRVDDILLTAGEKPLGTPAALAELAKQAGHTPLSITLLREGQRLTVKVTPRRIESYEALLSTQLIAAPAYRIGVDVAEASATLRSQLKLPKDQGLVINRFEPEKESPAFKAGLELHDVLLTVDGKPLKQFDDLRKAVAESQGKPLLFGLLRGGQRREISVTPKKEETGVTVWQQPDTAARLMMGIRLSQPALVDTDRQALRRWIVAPQKIDLRGPADSSLQLQQVLKQIDELRKTVENLQRTLPAAQLPKKAPDPQPPPKNPK